MVIIKYVCVGCGEEFEAQDWAKRKYCSCKCKGLHDDSGHFKKGHKYDGEIEAKRLNSFKNNPKMGQYWKGKKLSNEHKIKIGKSNLFPRNYKCGFYNYNKKIPTKKCSICGESEKKIIVHHKDKNRKNNEVSNLQALCWSCHKKLHNKLNGKVNKIDWNNDEEVKKYKKENRKG